MINFKNILFFILLTSSKYVRKQLSKKNSSTKKIATCITTPLTVLLKIFLKPLKKGVIYKKEHAHKGKKQKQIIMFDMFNK